MKFIKKYGKKILVIFVIVPMIFIVLTRFLFDILPGRKIATESDWINFSSAYIGVIGAVLIARWQTKKEERDEVKGLLCYIKDILEYNKNNYDLKYMRKMNSQALFIYNYKNEDYTNIKLKDFDLTKSDKLLLYKHEYKKFLELNKKIIKIINSYSFTNKEKNAFVNTLNLSKENSDKDDLKKELFKIFEIINKISLYAFSLNLEGKENKKSLKELKEQISTLNKKLIVECFGKEFENNISKFLDENNFGSVIFNRKKDLKKDLKGSYNVFMSLFNSIADECNLNDERILSKVKSKKMELFSDDYENLISEIEKEYKELEEKLEK